MSQPKRSRQGNAPSTLLNEHENQKLFSIVGSRSVSLASAVVQVMLAEPPNYNQWSKKCCGVACLIKDNHQRSYYIRVYDLKMKCCIWEQELYNQFKYLGTKPLFHTFEADNCPAGLNFANDNEANQFKKAVDDKLVQRQRRKQAPMAPAMPNFSTNQVGSGKDTLKKKDKGKDKKNKGKTVLTKADIGTPSDFRHVGHVGWDPSKGFDMDNLDPSLKQLFNHVGISVEELQDKETANFIYDFIEKHGGVDAVKQEQTTGESPRPAAPPPQAYTPAPEPYSAAPPAPPPGPPKLPSRGPSAPPPQRPTPSVPSLPPRTDRPGPPPPAPPPMNRSTPARGGPPPPPPSNRSAPAAAPPPAPPPPPPGPPPPPMSGGPPPPPAPPPPGIPPPGPPAPPPPPSNDGRTDLLAAIRNTGNKGGLKHVDADSRSAAPTDSRGALLSQIAQGHALKKVDPSERERPPSSGAEENSGLAGALKKALLDRAGYIQGQSSDEECDVDDDDEWED